MEANGPEGIMANYGYTLHYILLKRHQCWHFGLNFTMPKFQEYVMVHLGARAHYSNLGRCTTKTLHLLNTPLRLLATLAV